MPNIKSAKKRVKTNEIRRQRNVARRTEIKTIVKKYLEAVEGKDLQAAKSLIKQAKSKISKAAGKKVLKKNTASRKVSRLEKRLTIL